MSKLSLSRRALLAAGGASLAAPFVLSGRTPVLAAEPLKLSWNAGAVCFAPVAVAVRDKLFEKQGIDVELINFSGSTDQLLEAIATGKADAGVGMALRWLKPLEQGFDVKIVAGIHGGCMRLMASRAAGVATLEDLRGKTIGVSDMASPNKNFFAILLSKRGIDPSRDVEWRQFPAELLGAALEKGEIHAIADGDPLAYGHMKRLNLVEVASNVTGDYAHRTCCLIGVRGSLLRENRAGAQALTLALFEAQQFTARDPQSAAEAYAAYAPKFPVEDLKAMLVSHAHHHNPLGKDLRHQIVQYAEELKAVDVFKPKTDPVRFAERITADVV